MGTDIWADFTCHLVTIDLAWCQPWWGWECFTNLTQHNSLKYRSPAILVSWEQQSTLHLFEEKSKGGTFKLSLDFWV
jgi:hypothetical protein